MLILKIGILLIAVVIIAYLIRFLIRFYHFNFKQRYFKAYAMDWYSEAKRIDWRSAHLTYYYADFAPCIHQNTFDADGLIKVQLEDGSVFDHPCMIAEWTIIHFEKYLDHKNETDLKIFSQHLDWLHSNLKQDGTGAACWYYLFDASDEKAPFFSGISQGVGISALLRGYVFFKDEKYLTDALAAFEWMNREVEKNGCRLSNTTYDCWYEEDSHFIHILNGHIYSLLGIYDLYRVTKDEKILAWFEKGSESLIKNLNKFDLGFYSKYAADSNSPANNSYHLIQIAQLKILFGITGNSQYQQYATRFENYYYKPIYRVRMFLYLLKMAVLEKIK